MKNDFNEDINLVDELSIPTQEREIVQESEFEQKHIPFKIGDFSENATETEDEPTEPMASAKFLEPTAPPKVTPEESADSIIDIIDITTSTIFIPLIGKKLKQKFGSDVMLKAKDALLTELANPENLTEDEKVLIAKYKQFQAIMRETSGKIPFSDEEIRKLKPSTIRLCKKNGIQVNENIAFGANILKVLGTRIVDIVTL
tara:strand:- start:3462 stop:4064 length:603 start_codon:yes stop_codon:yes gene_type:complete